jgi:hypothetical protein
MKCSSLLGPFVSEEEIKVLFIWFVGTVFTIVIYSHSVATIVNYNRKTLMVQAAGNTKVGSITVLLTSCLISLESAV